MKEKKEIFEKEKRWILEEKYNLNNESLLDDNKKINFDKDIVRLQNHEPLAYIIGNMPFLNCVIDLEYRPLIPRSETEFWVNNFIQNDLKKRIEEKNKKEEKEENIFQKDKIEILDIFSGSGCIGTSVLKEVENLKNKFQNIFVDFSEINENFIKQIEKNIEKNLIDKKDKKDDKFKNNLKKNIVQKGKWKIYKSDIFKNLPQKEWDFILANPPYIPKNKKIDISVKNFEDYNSLFAEDNGLYFIKKIIIAGLKKLKKDGRIFIEFDETSKDKIEEFLKKNNLKKYQFKKDQYDNWRVLMIWN